MLWRSVRYFQAYATAKEGTLTVLEPSAIYPINWHAEQSEACKSRNETGEPWSPLRSPLVQVHTCIVTM